MSSPADPCESPAPQQARNPSHGVLVCVSFFVTGACGLIYEITAMRLFRVLLGSTTHAVTAVLCAFMAGMALGNLLGGRIADRRGDALRLFGVFEGVVAVSFLFLPGVLDACHPLYGWVYRHVHGSFGVLRFIQFAFCIGLLSVPCVSMGATLPLVARHLARGKESGAGRVALAYGVNTVGASMGALLAGFVLLPVLGVGGTLRLSCAVAGVVSVVALLVSRTERSTPASVDGAQEPEQHPAKRGPIHVALGKGGVRILLAGYGAAGAASMIYEIGWARALSTLIGSSVYAFSLMLAAFILGLGLGSLIVSRMVSRIRRPVLALAAIEAAVGATALAVLPFFGLLPGVTLNVISSFTSTFWLLQLVEFAVVFAIMILPTTLMGAAFPLLTRILLSSGARLGKGVGSCASANTIGCVFGVLAGGLLLLPAVGLQRTLLAAALINVVVGCCFILCSGLSRARRTTLAGALAAAGTGAALLMPGWSITALTFAPFMKAVKQTPGSPPAEYRGIEPAGLKTLYHRDGLCSTVTVKETREGERVILAGGKPDASSKADLPTQIAAAHLPLLFHPRPKRALVIGLASGITVGSAGCHPLDVVDCVEIEPRMLEACRFFDEHNYRVLDDSRVRVIIADGRNYLDVVSEEYDVIISEPTNPWIAGIGDLFTLEYFQLCRKRLSRDGIICVWLDAYALDAGCFRSVVHTLQSVFPYLTIWSVLRSDYLLVGSAESPKLAVAELERRLAAPAVARDLARVNIESILDLFGNLVTGPAGTRRVGGDAELHTDDNALLEFGAPRAMILGRAARLKVLAAVEEERGVDLSLLEPGAGTALALQVSARMEARGLVVRSAVMEHRGQGVAAQAALVRAAGLSPSDPFLATAVTAILSRGARLARTGRFGDAERAYRHALRVNGKNAGAHYGLGFVLEKAGKAKEAFPHYASAAALDPGSAKYQVAAAAACYRRGDAASCIRHYRRALALDTGSAEIRNNLAWALASAAPDELRDVAEGARLAAEACELTDWRNLHVAETLARIYLLERRKGDAIAALQRVAWRARAAGDTELAKTAEDRVRAYEVAVRKLQ